MTRRAEIFKNHFFESLKELSDRNYQERIWTNKDNPEGLVASFTEAAILLWDDALVKHALEENAIIYDKEVTQALQKLWDAIEVVDEFRSTEEIINDPLMQKVRDKASEVLALIEASDKSENTVTFIEEGTLRVLEP
jgi:hypothetical protein